MGKTVADRLREILKGRSHHPGIVSSIAGETVDVRLSNTGVTMRDLHVSGYMPSLGEHVYVNFQVDPPIVISSAVAPYQSPLGPVGSSRAQNSRAMMLASIGVDDLWGGIRLYSYEGVLKGSFPTSGSGFDQAVAASESKDSIHIPPCEISGDHLLPHQELFIVGYSTKSVIFTGMLTSGSGNNFENFSIINHGTSGSPIVGLWHRGINRLKRITIDVSNSGTGGAMCAQPRAMGSSLRARECTFKSSGDCYYTRLSPYINTEVVERGTTNYSDGSKCEVVPLLGMGGAGWVGVSPKTMRESGIPEYATVRGQTYVIIRVDVDLTDFDWTQRLMDGTIVEECPYRQGEIVLEWRLNGFFQGEPIWQDYIFPDTAIPLPPDTYTYPQLYPAYKYWNLWGFNPDIGDENLPGYTPNNNYKPSYFSTYAWRAYQGVFSAYPKVGPDDYGSDLIPVWHTRLSDYAHTGNSREFAPGWFQAPWYVKNNYRGLRIYLSDGPRQSFYVGLVDPTFRSDNFGISLGMAVLEWGIRTGVDGYWEHPTGTIGLYWDGAAGNGLSAIDWWWDYEGNYLPPVPWSVNHFFNCTFSHGVGGYDIMARGGSTCFVHNCVYDNTLGDIRFEQKDYIGVSW